MAKKPRRGVIPKCPRFGDVPNHPGEQQCFIRRDGVPFRIVRYKKSGNLVAWVRPKGKHPYSGAELPVSTPTTRSLKELMTAATKFVNKVRTRHN